MRGRMSRFRVPIPKRSHVHHAASVDTTGFPHLWMYFGTLGSGVGAGPNNLGTGIPFMTSPGVYDSSTVARLALWDYVTLNTSPFSNTDHPENLVIISQLRALNANIKILWYDLFIAKFQNLSAAGTSMWGDEWALAIGPPDYRLIEDGTGLPYPQSFSADALNCWCDVSPTIASQLAIWNNYVGGKADGYFLDFFNTAYDSAVDSVAAGYANDAELNAAITTAADTLVTGLNLTGLTYGNRGATAMSNSVAYKLTGELFEGWVNTAAATTSGFDTYMNLALRWQGSSAAGSGTALLKSETALTQADANYHAIVRFTLGSACIVGGRSYVGNNRCAADVNLWADEYSVHNGSTDTSGAYRGWLGMPTEFGYKDATTGMYVRHFDHGVVVVNRTGSSQTIDLGRQYRRIQGAYATSVNDGSLVQSLTVPDRDARLLLAV